MLEGVIFDFDGIIVDTEPLHYRAFQEILQPLGLGYSWERYVETYMGFDDRDAFREAFAEGGATALAESRLEELIAAKAAAFLRIAAGVQPYPGVDLLLRSLSGTLPLGLCSGALPSDIEPILQGLGLTGVFDIMVTASDVAVSKPDPASYRLALQRLSERYGRHLDPASCVAIEDTPAGIASARGAGMKVLAVTNSYPAGNLSAADRIVSSLADVDPDFLRTLP